MRDEYYRQKYLAEQRYSRMLESLVYPLIGIITFMVVVILLVK